MNRLKTGFLMLCFTVPGLLKAQTITPVQKNLVPNGSFENYRKKSGSIKQAIPWTQNGSVDFYQSPVGEDTCHIRGGYYSDCYIGLRFQKRYKEFAQVKLAEALHRGTVYDFEMHVRLAYWSNALLKSIGVLISKGGYHGQGDAVKANIVDSICKKGGFVNNYQWFTIKGKYKADGGEKYLTVGNFFPKVEKDLIRINIFKFGFREAYYFIDEISLYKAKEAEEKVAVEYVGSIKPNEEDSVLTVKKDIKVGEKVALKNIFFENGKYYLLPESYLELNKLAQYLIRNPHMQIQINGHSDNTGSRNKNQRLSELRAREVFEYLIKKGVQNKMYFKGYGSSQPVASNDTDEGQQKNRRVEFEIIKTN
jgi:outer membrane protein OmpA-like peptidoglycan-associated protein